ncbi:hypothetical protein QR680_013293 [Steinernema hermaphroditum]|uniref:Tetraspanin n=1 Tax=Steinernema hermaphroditum TaxID=289476 RepID=A0AA39M1B2_9BILA|nr:hypothetical protein QR680_013293 [Steinernema hermaphroditum]
METFPTASDCSSSWTSESSSSFAESIRRCKMGSGGDACSRCSRVVLGVMNTAMLLAALALLGLVIWIRVDPHFEAEIRQNLLNDTIGDVETSRRHLRTGILVAFWVLVGFGVAASLIGLLGALAGCCRSRALLGLYFTTMAVLVLLEIALGIFVLVFRPKIKDEVERYVNLVFSDSTSSSDVAAFTHRYNCCSPSFSGPVCQPGVPTCTAAVWDRLDFSLMVTGIALLGVLVLQIATQCFSLALLVKSRYRPDDDED